MQKAKESFEKLRRLYRLRWIEGIKDEQTLAMKLGISSSDLQDYLLRLRRMLEESVCMKQRFLNSKSAYISIILFGIVSLMGDVVYEGARGIVPSYLEFLGASAVIVGLVGGLGDFLGYALRFVSGFFIFLGY